MGGGGGGGGGEVVELEDAVKLLVEHLVMPVLPRGALKREEDLGPEKQEIVARQVHATVLLYNYYHRKQFPQLDFADPKRFSMSASLAAGALLAYLNQVHSHGGNGAVGDAEAGLSVTDKAIVDACNIAGELDASLVAPEMTIWPISKVAVLLLDQTRTRCLIEHGAVTKGVWSIVEKEVTAALDNSSSIDLPVQGSKNKALPSDIYLLQQIAFSEAESKTGMKRTSLRFIEEHLVYSLGKKGTTTKLFVVQYEQTVNSNLKEMPLEDLISRMSGPIFKSDPYPMTTSVVECYHILPYKEVLLNLLNREWPLDSSQSAPKEQSFRNEKSSLHSEIDESWKEQEANSKSKMKKATTNVSAPKKNKSVVKTVGNSGTNNCSTSKSRKNSKRKSEAIKATPAASAEHWDGQSPTKENGQSIGMDKAITHVEETSVSNSVNVKVIRATKENGQSIGMDKAIMHVEETPLSNSVNVKATRATKENGHSIGMDKAIMRVEGPPVSNSVNVKATRATKENGQSIGMDKVITGVEETPASNSVNVKVTRATSGVFIDLEASVQMDKNRTEKQSMSMPRDIIMVKAPEVDTVMKNHAFESQNEKVTENSGDNMNDQMYASLLLLQKMRDDILREQCMLGDRSAQCDMDIQTILTEGEMTPRVMSILKRYEEISSNMKKVANSTSCGEGCHTMNIKRKRLTEAILLRNKCQELDDICRENNWILPRYNVLPSVTDGTYQASVYLMGLDFNMSVEGDMKATPREARHSAASNMLYQLHQKVKEKIAEQDSGTPDAALAFSNLNS